jgi:hypothetical protein
LYRFDFGSPCFQDSAMDPSAIFATQRPQAASINEQMEKLHKELTRILGTAAPAPTTPGRTEEAKDESGDESQAFAQTEGNLGQAQSGEELA